MDGFCLLICLFPAIQYLLVTYYIVKICCVYQECTAWSNDFSVGRMLVCKFRRAQTLIKAALLFRENVNNDGSEFTDELT